MRIARTPNVIYTIFMFGTTPSHTHIAMEKGHKSAIRCLLRGRDGIQCHTDTRKVDREGVIDCGQGRSVLQLHDDEQHNVIT